MATYNHINESINANVGNIVKINTVAGDTIRGRITAAGARRVVVGIGGGKRRYIDRLMVASVTDITPRPAEPAAVDTNETYTVAFDIPNNPAGLRINTPVRLSIPAPPRPVTPAPVPVPVAPVFNVRGYETDPVAPVAYPVGVVSDIAVAAVVGFASVVRWMVAAVVRLVVRAVGVDVDTVLLVGPVLAVAVAFTWAMVTGPGPFVTVADVRPAVATVAASAPDVTPGRVYARWTRSTPGTHTNPRTQPPGRVTGHHTASQPPVREPGHTPAPVPGPVVPVYAVAVVAMVARRRQSIDEFASEIDRPEIMRMISASILRHYKSGEIRINPKCSLVNTKTANQRITEIEQMYGA